MLRIYLDIETIPPDRDDPSVGERIAKINEEDYRRLALNEDYGRILCIGLIIEQENRITQRGVLGRDKNTGKLHLNETRTLRAFWKLLKNFNPRRDLLIGFNLLDFDLHFICTRSVIKRVKPSYNICFARFRSSPVYDVMWEFTHWRHRFSLDELANILGLESSKRNGIDGGAVYDLFISGRHQEIADYNMRDVEVTRAIYRRLNFLDDLEPE
jgi:predicted 3'-5' exonuclease similar to PolB exonuclease domain